MFEIGWVVGVLRNDKMPTSYTFLNFSIIQKIVYSSAVLQPLRMKETKNVLLNSFHGLLQSVPEGLRRECQMNGTIEYLLLQ